MGHEREKKGERAIGRHERETRDSRRSEGKRCTNSRPRVPGRERGEGEGEEETKPRVGGR